MLLPPDPTYNPDEAAHFHEAFDRPVTFWDRMKAWPREFLWETNDLLRYNTRAAVTLAVVSFLLGALLF